MKKRYVYVQKDHVGLQSRDGELLGSVLPSGEHFTDTEVAPIKLREEVVLSFAEGSTDRRVRLQYDLNQHRLLALFQRDEWKSIRPAQVGEFIAGVGLAVLKEALLATSRLLRNKATPTIDDFIRTYERLDASERHAFRQGLVTHLKKQVDQVCPSLLFSAIYVIEAGRKH